MDSRAFKRRMLSCAGNPLIAALGALLLVGCTEEPPDLPEHAFVYYGDEWKCDRAFRRVEDECQSVEVPEHSLLSYYGDDWRCERDYERADGECSSLEVPEHAYLDFTGHDWVCDRGFKREGNRCSPE